MNKVSLNFLNFSYYVFHPDSEELSSTDQKMALLGTILLSGTVGVGHLICAGVYWYNKKEIDSSRAKIAANIASVQEQKFKKLEKQKPIEKHQPIKQKKDIKQKENQKTNIKSSTQPLKIAISVNNNVFQQLGAKPLKAIREDENLRKELKKSFEASKYNQFSENFETYLDLNSDKYFKDIHFNDKSKFENFINKSIKTNYISFINGENLQAYVHTTDFSGRDSLEDGFKNYLFDLIKKEVIWGWGIDRSQMVIFLTPPPENFKYRDGNYFYRVDDTESSYIAKLINVVNPSSQTITRHMEL